MIESAQLIKRTTTVNGMYVATYTQGSGYEMRMLIRPVDLAADTDKSRHWRALRVSEVCQALAVKYPMTP